MKQPLDHLLCAAKHVMCITLLALCVALTATPASAHAARQATTAPHTRWCAPLAGQAKISRYFDLPFKYGAGHRGLDVQGVGSEVRAPAAGTVTFVGLVVDRQVISVRVSEKLVYSLEPVESDLQVGDTVSRCDVLGNLETGGHTGSEDVHIGVRIADEYVNPLRFFRGRPVLQPTPR